MNDDERPAAVPHSSFNDYDRGINVTDGIVTPLVQSPMWTGLGSLPGSWPSADAPNVFIENAKRELVNQQNADLEKYLLDFFGDEATARSNAHLYVLERHPSEVAVDDSADSTRLQVTEQYRLRLKTKEEIAEEQA